MVGTDLNLSLPQIGDTLSDIVTKLQTAFTAIEDSLATRVTPSGLDMSASLDMAGNYLTNVGAAIFRQATPTVTPGSLFYQSNEWFMVDAAGAVQITLNGALNAASIGSITGMSGGAAVAYDLASQEYRFTASPGVPADLTCDDLVLNGASGTVRVNVGAGITSGRTININELPASGVSMLTYDAASSNLADAKTIRATNVVKVTDLDYTGAIKHPEITHIQGLEGAIVTTGTLSPGISGSPSRPEWAASVSAVHTHKIRAPLIPGISRLKKIEIVSNGVSTPTFTILSEAVFPVVMSTVAFTQSSSTSGGFTKYTFTVNTPATLAVGTTLFLKIVEAGAGANTHYSIITTYDAV
jgi:hypothetical protein